MSQAKSTGPLLQRHSLNMISLARNLHANLLLRFLDQKLSYRSYRTLLPCSPTIGNLAEHRPSVHSVSASCIPGKFLDNSEVVVLVVRILYNQEILRHKLRSAKKPCIYMCVLCCFTLQKPNTKHFARIFIERSCRIDRRQYT